MKARGMKLIVALVSILTLSMSSLSVFAQDISQEVGEQEADEAEARGYFYPDSMKMREVYTDPKCRKPDGVIEYLIEARAKYTNYVTSSQTIALSISLEKQAETQQKIEQKGYTLLGYRTTVVYEMTGDSEDKFKRRIVTEIPQGIPEKSSMLNGLYKQEFQLSVDQPNLTWKGYFQRPNGSKNMFTAYSTFLTQ